MTYKVGIAGYGVVGKRRHAALKKIHDFEVTSLSDISFKDEDNLLNLNCYSDYKAVSYTHLTLPTIYSV